MSSDTRSLDPLLARIEPEGTIPPLDHWDPPLSGEMDLVIKADGRWLHEGTPMARSRLIRLLSTVLRREADGEHYLVTPVEKWRIRVEDRPLLVVDADRDDEEGRWWLTTNTGDRLSLDATHRFTLSDTPGGETVPEVAVRYGLAARLHRNLYYRLVEQAERRLVDGAEELGLTSAGVWQPLGRFDGEAS